MVPGEWTKPTSRWRVFGPIFIVPWIPAAPRLTSGYRQRDAAAAKVFFQRALRAPGHPRPRVINVDGNPSYPKVITELKREHKFGCRCRCRTCPYLNNMVEQDHRAIKRRVNASQGFRSFEGAWRTIQGYEVLHMIRKGQVRWLRKEDVVGQVQFVNETLGLKAA